MRNDEKGFYWGETGKKPENQGKILIKKQLKSVKFGELKLVVATKLL